jgi:hypothetical protein
MWCSLTFTLSRGVPLGLNIGATVAKNESRPEILSDLFQLWLNILVFGYSFGINTEKNSKNFFVPLKKILKKSSFSHCIY